MSRDESMEGRDTVTGLPAANRWLASSMVGVDGVLGISTLTSQGPLLVPNCWFSVTLTFYICFSKFFLMTVEVVDSLTHLI